MFNIKKFKTNNQQPKPQVQEAKQAQAPAKKASKKESSEESSTSEEDVGQIFPNSAMESPALEEQHSVLQMKMRYLETENKDLRNELKSLKLRHESLQNFSSALGNISQGLNATADHEQRDRFDDKLQQLVEENRSIETKYVARIQQLEKEMELRNAEDLMNRQVVQEKK